jgi:hypothetical protein
MQRALTTLLLLLLAAVAAAQTRPADESVLRSLADADYETRERATRALLADDALSVADLTRLYAASTLPEQRHRLLDAAHHHFIRRLVEQQFPVAGNRDARRAVGSLGLSLLRSVGPAENIEGPDAGRSAARVGLTYPGFPAYVWLQPGDLIIAVDGLPLPASDDAEVVQTRFVQLVQRHAAGESIKLTLYREGKRMEVTSKLAPYEALTQLYVQAELSLMPNLQQRWLTERRRITAGHPPEPPLTPAPEKPGPVSAPEEPRTHVNPSADDDADAGEEMVE